MKIYDRTKTYARDTIGRDKHQHVMPWAPGLTCSVSQAAERLGVGYETALAMVHKGELQAWPITKNAKSPWRVSIDAVELWLDRKLRDNAIDDKELERRLEKRIAGLSGTPNRPGVPGVRSSKDLR